MGSGVALSAHLHETEACSGGDHDHSVPLEPRQHDASQCAICYQLHTARTTELTPPPAIVFAPGRPELAVLPPESRLTPDAVVTPRCTRAPPQA